MMRFALALLMAIFCAGTVLAAPCSPPVYSSVIIKEETAGFSVDLEYPVLCADSANRSVRDQMQAILADFKAFEPDHDLSRFPHPYELFTRYSVWSAAKGRFASVKLAVSTYTGGAHPNHFPTTLVFDLEKDTTLGLDDLFTDTEKALQTISTICREVLATHLGKDWSYDIAPGTEPTRQNFKRFVLTDEGVAFFFMPYQVAPYAAGEQVVTIPWTDMSDFIAPWITDSIRQ